LSFTDREPITSFARYLSSDWLGTTHIDQQLELLRIRLFREHSIHEFEILTTYIVNVIVQAHCRHQHDYPTNQRFRHIQARGEELSVSGCRMRIGGVANVNENHWVTVVVDLRSSTILYGDSLGLSENDIVAAFSWWASFHTGRQFTRVSLSIGIQTDTVSCGLFALSALTHHFFSDSTMVGQWTVSMERLQSFCASGYHELNAVSVAYRNPEPH
jgi:hypothetical protein